MPFQKLKAKDGAACITGWHVNIPHVDRDGLTPLELKGLNTSVTSVQFNAHRVLFSRKDAGEFAGRNELLLLSQLLLYGYAEANEPGLTMPIITTDPVVSEGDVA